MARILAMLTAVAAVIVFVVLIVEPSPVLGVVDTVLLLAALGVLGMSRRRAEPTSH